MLSLSKIKHGLVVCFVSLAAAVLLLRSPLDSPAVLVAEPLDLADVWETSHHQHRLQIFNPGPTPVEITGFRTSCSCVVTGSSSLFIPARQRRMVELDLDLTSADESGRFAVSVEPKGLNPGLQNLQWTIHGIVRPHPVSISPSSLKMVLNGTDAFGSIPGDNTVTAVIQSTIPLRRLTVESPGAPVLAVIDPVEEGARGNMWRLQVRPDEGLFDPLTRFTVLVHAETVAGDRLPPIAVPVTVERSTRVIAAPSWLSFGAVALNEKRVATVSIRSCDGRPFRIVETNVDAEILAFAPKGAKTAHSLQVWLRSGKFGNQMQRLRIIIDADEWSGVDVVDVPIHWYGVGSIAHLGRTVDR